MSELKENSIRKEVSRGVYKRTTWAAVRATVKSLLGMPASRAECHVQDPATFLPVQLLAYAHAARPFT